MIVKMPASTQATTTFGFVELECCLKGNALKSYIIDPILLIYITRDVSAEVQIVVCNRSERQREEYANSNSTNTHTHVEYATMNLIRHFVDFVHSRRQKMKIRSKMAKLHASCTFLEHA